VVAIAAIVIMNAPALPLHAAVQIICRAVLCGSKLAQVGLSTPAMKCHVSSR